MTVIPKKKPANNLNIVCCKHVLFEARVALTRYSCSFATGNIELCINAVNVENFFIAAHFTLLDFLAAFVDVQVEIVVFDLFQVTTESV